MVFITALCRRLNVQVIKCLDKYFTTINNGKYCQVLVMKWLGKNSCNVLFGEDGIQSISFKSWYKKHTHVQISMILMILICDNNIPDPLSSLLCRSVTTIRKYWSSELDFLLYCQGCNKQNLSGKVIQDWIWRLDVLS